MKSIRNKNELIRSTFINSSAIVSEVFTNIKTVYELNLQNKYISKYNESLYKPQKSLEHKYLLSNVFSSCTSVAKYIALIIGYIFTAKYIDNGTVVFVKIIGYFNRIVLNGHIEVSKRDNQKEIDKCVQQRIGVKYAPHLVPEGIGRLASVDQHLDGCGNRDDSGGKDDGHNAGHIDLDGNEGLLTADHLSALDLLGILHGNLAL